MLGLAMCLTSTAHSAAALAPRRPKLVPKPNIANHERVRTAVRRPVLDVRPEDEYALGHVPGAINVPLQALKNHLAKFNRSKEIVAYCRGPYCVLSFEAVARLRAKGYDARRLEDGFPEWKAAGLPTA